MAEPSADPHRIRSMEGLRGLAVTLVFFVHYTAAFTPWLATESVTSTIRFLEFFGSAGVDIFFAISGYLIYGAIISKQTDYWRFMRRRVQRIYPTFLMVFAIYLVLGAVFPERSKIPREAPAASVYLIQNILLLPGIFNLEALITVAWSLSYEFFFYLTAPLGVLVLNMRRWPSVYRVGFLLMLAAAYTVYCFFGPQPRIQMILFIAGILVYESFHSFPSIAAATKTKTLAVLLVVLVGAPFVSYWDAQEKAAYQFVVFRAVTLFLMCYLFLLSTFSRGSFFDRVFSWTPIRCLGNMSYSYYLIHGLTILAVEHVLGHFVTARNWGSLAFWFAMVPVFSATLISSAVLFAFIEKPFSLQKRRVVAYNHRSRSPALRS